MKRASVFSKMNKMKTGIHLLLCLILPITIFCSTREIKNSGNTFTPASITINFGDDVHFDLQDAHNAREVSQATWIANGNIPLSGGFETPFGGGFVFADKLTVGTHWYVCVPHAELGMKGIIIVKEPTSTSEGNLVSAVSAYPNPFWSNLYIQSVLSMEGQQYEITDAFGRKVMTGILNDNTTEILIIQLRSGIYYCRIAGQKNVLIKLIKTAD
jgi:plastocyanin